MLETERGSGEENASIANATGVAVATTIAIVFTHKLIPSEGRIRCCLGAAEITQPINLIKKSYANNNKSGCVLAQKKMRSRELAQLIGITEQNLSLLKSGKVKSIRFATLEKICEVLECQPGDILACRREE